MELLAADTQVLLQGIQELYTLRNLNTFRTDVLKIVDRLVQSEIPAFHTTYIDSRRVFHTFLPDFPGLPPEIEQAIIQHFDEHPIAQKMPHTLESAYKISDFLNQKDLHRLVGLYQRYLRFLEMEDQLTMFLPRPKVLNGDRSQATVPLVGVSLLRPERSFTDRDRLMLNLLRPHLFQAYCNVQHYEQLQQAFTQLQKSCDRLGLVVLNGVGQVQMITSQAALSLQTYFPDWTCFIQLPELLSAWVRRQVACFTDPHTLFQPLPLYVEQAGKRLAIRFIVEAEERYLLLVEEQTLFSISALELLGLSPREAEVLFWIIRGKDNSAIATQLSLHRSTIRKHLENIYRKLGVQSRAEAITQALDRLGVLSSPPLL